MKTWLLLTISAALLAGLLTWAPWKRPIRPDIVIGDLPDVLASPRCENERRVETADQLEQVLLSEFVGCVIVTKNKFLNMTGRNGIPIHGGVTLMGERGELGSRPSLFLDNICEDPQVKDIASPRCGSYVFFDITENNVSVTGLHIRGPAKGIRSSNAPGNVAIKVHADPNNKLGRGIYIGDNEIDEWAKAILVMSPNQARLPEEYHPEWTPLTKDDAQLIRVERNFLHHNARDDAGYGVEVSDGAYATIFGNVFDFNRHAIASDGFAKTGYIARFNYVLEGGFKQRNFYNQHFDVHGTADGDGDGKSDGYGGSAGEYFEIAFNAFRGEQEYYCFVFCFATRPAVLLRGKPTIEMRYESNVAAHDDFDAAISLKTSKNSLGGDPDEFNFKPANNQFDTDRSGFLATGDFDGDGHTDVLVTTGTAWFFSSGGVAPWEFLHASTKLTTNLGFADIDNDGITDVLYRDGAGNLGFLKSGREPLQPLTTTPEPMSKLRFGDFDGDGLTDIFFSHDRQWQVWYGRLKAWQPTASSGFPVENFLFGEFDAIKGTDVAAIEGGKWKISSASTGSWSFLNEKRKSSFKGAVVADFDGDGRSDIAFDEGNQMWSFSPGGAGTLHSLREGDGQSTNYPALNRLLVGHFDGDPRAEVVSWQVPSGESVPGLPNHFMIWRGEIRKRFEPLSLHAMR